MKPGFRVDRVATSMPHASGLESGWHGTTKQRQVDTRLCHGACFGKHPLSCCFCKQLAFLPRHDGSFQRSDDNGNELASRQRNMRHGSVASRRVVRRPHCSHYRWHSRTAVRTASRYPQALTAPPTVGPFPPARSRLTSRRRQTRPLWPRLTPNINISKQTSRRT